MDACFTLPYSEACVIDEFQHSFVKKDGYSIYVPVSRQEKAVDFILINHNSTKFAKFQVKSSRNYDGNKKKKKPDYTYNMWFNNFINKYKKGAADFYILFGLYPVYNTNSKINSKSQTWERMVLCIPDKDMGDILKKVLTKKEGKPDSFFGISFNEIEEICGSRGFKDLMKFEKYRLSNQIEVVKQFFKK